MILIRTSPNSFHGFLTSGLNVKSHGISHSSLAKSIPMKRFTNIVRILPFHRCILQGNKQVCTERLQRFLGKSYSIPRISAILWTGIRIPNHLHLCYWVKTLLFSLLNKSFFCYQLQNNQTLLNMLNLPQILQLLKNWKLVAKLPFHLPIYMAEKFHGRSSLGVINAVSSLCGKKRMCLCPKKCHLFRHCKSLHKHSGAFCYRLKFFENYCYGSIYIP